MMGKESRRTRKGILSIGAGSNRRSHRLAVERGTNVGLREQGNISLSLPTLDFMRKVSAVFRAKESH
jgi:hypothetical protein